MFCENCGKQIVEDSQFCEFCGTKQLITKIASPSSVIAPVAGKTQIMEKWLTQKNIFGLAATLIAVSLFYYFLIRPIQEKRAYEDCFGALNEAGLINSITQTSEKNFRIDSCVKSRNADEIRKNSERENAAKEAEQAARVAEEQRKASQEAAEKEAKKLSYDQFSKISRGKISVERRDDWSGTMILRGTITNSNLFDIQNIRLRTSVTSDKAGKNKIDEQDCEIRNFIVYANTTKEFEAYCKFQSGYSWSKIISAEKI